MKKEYMLFLDESGDFEKNLTQDRSNECLVGGLLINMKNERSHNEIRSAFAKAVKSVVPDAVNMKDFDVFQKFNHATELSSQADKAEISRAILEAGSKLGKFVLFENHAKNKILDSTRTYLYIMVDGILQLLDKLIEDNPGEQVVLKVIAGERQDRSEMERTGDQTKKYISREKYVTLLSEQLQYLKVKHPQIVIKNGQVEVELENDKTFPYLSFADYVCNTYFTRTCAAFKKDYDGMSYWEYLEKLYDEEYIFSMEKNTEKELLDHYLKYDDYAAALYDVCAGAITDERNIDIIIRRLSDSGQKMQSSALIILTEYINRVLESRDLAKSQNILDNADRLSEKMKNAGVENSEFILNICLYRITLLNHQGRINEMERLFESCRRILLELLEETGNLEYAYIFYNRYAVYLIDCFRFKEAEDVLTQAEKAFDIYNLAFDELKEIRINEDKLVSMQKGKILGTLVQCRTAMLYDGEMTYDEVVSTGEKACLNLRNESDRRRQYQYLATAAEISGKYDDAKKYLCLGFGTDEWKQILSNENNQQGFALYHLSAFARHFAGTCGNDKEVGEIIRSLKDNAARFFNMNGHPYFLTCANLATAIMEAGKDISEAEKYFRSSITPKEEVLLEILSLIVFAEFIGWKGDKNQAEDLLSMKNRCECLLNSGEMNPETESIINTLQNLVVEHNYDALKKAGWLRQY